MAPVASLRRWGAGALVAAAAIASAVFVLYPRSTPEPPRRADAARLMNELMSGKVPVGGPFTLTDQNGKPTSLSDFRGKLVLLYFGFTYCPDVCPTDLLAIGEAIRSLGNEGDALQPIFITLDPERDTRDTLRAYVASFHPRFVALSGTVDEIRTVATAYKVFFEKVWPKGLDTYMIDHAVYTFLLDRDGRYLGAFPPGTTAGHMAAGVSEHLASR